MYTSSHMVAYLHRTFIHILQEREREREIATCFMITSGKQASTKGHGIDIDC